MSRCGAPKIWPTNPALVFFPSRQVSEQLGLMIGRNSHLIRVFSEDGNPQFSALETMILGVLPQGLIPGVPDLHLFQK